MLRFALVGGANTLATAAAFYALATVLAPRIAFSIVYAAGLAFVVVVTPGYVFGTHSSWRRRLILALWYVVTYLVGLGVVSVLASALSAPRIVVVLATVMVTAPLSFLGATLLVGRQS